MAALGFLGRPLLREEGGVRGNETANWEMGSGKFQSLSQTPAADQEFWALANGFPLEKDGGSSHPGQPRTGDICLKIRLSALRPAPSALRNAEFSLEKAHVVLGSSIVPLSINLFKEGSSLWKA
jgi:hypothetical protein